MGLGYQLFTLVNIVRRRTQEGTAGRCASGLARSRGRGLALGHVFAPVG